MDNGVGSSVVIVIAAALWFIYLVPTWLRRRQYLSTERNAVRLQQTLRILAETAEVPVQVRAEASARSIAEQQKVLRAQQQLDAAAARAQAAAAARAARIAAPGPLSPRLDASRAERMAANRAILPRPVSSRRLRRSRLLASFVLFTALIASGFGAASAVTAPGVFGSWLLLIAGLTVSVGAFVLLGQMAAVSRARMALSRLAPVAESTRMPEPHLPHAVSGNSWTPVPVPKPLYLSRPQQAASSAYSAYGTHSFAPAAARTDQLRAELVQAAAASDAALRAAPQPPAIRPAAAELPASSRFARMGLVEESDAALTDLDAVLRRRRAVS